MRPWLSRLSDAVWVGGAPHVVSLAAPPSLLNAPAPVVASELCRLQQSPSSVRSVVVPGEVRRAQWMKSVCLPRPTATGPSDAS